MAVLLTVVGGCAHRPTAGAPDGEKGGVVTVAANEEAVGRAFAGRRFALLIGINEVEDERWRRLKYAAKDASDLSQVLSDPARGAYDSVVVLSSKEETTRDRVRAEIKELAKVATHPEDVVVLYVSAHGTLARDNTGSLKRYLVTSDADYRRVAQTALAIDDLPVLLKDSASRRRVIFLATCHSGSGKSLLTGDVEAEVASLKGPSVARPLEEASKASLIFSASDWGETAREDDTLENDVYTHFLVEALVGPGDRNGDGAVTATEAHDWARRRTWVFSEGRQRPSAEILEVGADPVILSGRITRSGQPELYSYAPRLDGFTLLVDGQERAELPGGVAISKGDHRVELTKGDVSLFKEDLKLDVGQRLDLEDLVKDREPSRSISFVVGGFSFLDAASRNTLLPAGPSFGVAARFDHLILNRMGLALDVSGFGGIQQLTLSGQTIPFAWSSMAAGVTPLIGGEWRWLSLWAGPRLAVLWVSRSFNLMAYQSTQSVFTVTPGLMVGAAIRLSPHLELTLSLQTVLSFLSVDGKPQVVGLASGFAGVGYRY